jgi:phage/plasmid-like protein (TIGR03299 family)
MSFLTKVDTQDIHEAMEIANHNFEVAKVPLKTADGIDVPDHVGIINTSTNQYLGTVGKGWTPVQPEVIYDMANHLIESTEGKINGVFNMFDGSVIGVSFNLANREYVAGDPTELNFLMCTSFNGMYGISGSATTKRMACLNEVNTSNKVYNLRHTRFVNNRLEVVKNILQFYDKEIKEFDKKMNKLANIRMGHKEAVEWFRSLFPEPKSTKSEKLLDNQTSIFVNLLVDGRGSNIVGVKGTSYGAFQALTEYINHHRSVKVHNGREEAEVKFQSIHFGTGNGLAQKGLNSLTEGIVTEFSDDDFLID